MDKKVEPWQVWWVDFEPVSGHEQGKARPAIIVSSSFHLRLMRNELLSVLPLTTVERPEWLHRVKISLSAKKTSWAITEQIRTLSSTRLSGNEPIGKLNSDEIAEVRSVLAKMLDI